MSFELELNDCVAPLGAELIGDVVAVKGVSIDSRTVKPGELYVAIVGERFDGHDFVAAAQEAGAAAILVHDEINCELPQLRVANTQVALGQLGKFWAGRFSIPTVAITGSNGKTTVKEIVTSILRQQGPVLATRGNLNNELGVPLTLLNMRKEHIYAVIEMGASHAGEIARLVALAEPDVCVVTNIGTAHLEGFGSVQGIADAKSEIYAGLKPGGYGVINADDPFADDMRAACSHCRTREFGRSPEADVCGLPGKELVIDSIGKILTLRFRLTGEHNVMNALAAVAAAQCLDIQVNSIVNGLEAVSPVPGRLEKKSGINGAVVIDDSYNANPDSVRSAIKVLSAYRGSRYLVLGDMAELGSDASAMHASVGKFAREQGIDGLWTTGALSSNTHKAFSDSALGDVPECGAHFDDQESLINSLRNHLTNDVTVLIKGSRSAGMEQVVNAVVVSGAGALKSASTGARL
ncbi:MAG: UDP-N-acetylmuramoyl-tripeptide--D-alanyl-D-alanine ligase [Granulosicoccus sp.]